MHVIGDDRELDAEAVEFLAERPGPGPAEPAEKRDHPTADIRARRASVPLQAALLGKDSATSCGCLAGSGLRSDADCAAFIIIINSAGR